MFLHALTREQQIAFARAAVHIVHAHESFVERTEVLLDTVRLEIGLDELPGDPGREDVVRDMAVFDGGVAKRIALFELAGIATSDDQIHDEELDALEDIAASLSLSDDELRSCLELADRAHRAYLDASRFVEGDVEVPSA